MTAMDSGDPAHDLKAGRKALAVLLFVVFLNLVGFGVLIPILPFYGKSFDAPAWQVALVFSAFSLGNFFAEPLWGRLSDRVGRRPILIGTIFASGLSFLALAFAPTIGAACLIRFLGGLCTGNLSTIQGYIADVTPPAQRAGRMGWLGAAFGLGFVVGPVVGGFLADPGAGGAGFRPPLLLAGSLSFLAALGVVLFVRESRAPGAPETPDLRFAVLRQVRASPVLSRALIVTLLSTGAFAAAESTFGLWSQARYGWGPRELSVCFVFAGVTAALGQGFLTGRLTRRYGEALVLAGGLVLLSATLGAQPFVHGMAQTVALLALTVLGQALVLPNVAALISRAAPPDRQGAVLGVNMAAGALARAAGPAAGGALFSIVGPDAPLLFAALLIAPAVLVALQAEQVARRRLR